MDNIPPKILDENQLVDIIKQVYEAGLSRHGGTGNVSTLADDIVEALMCKYSADSGKALNIATFLKTFPPGTLMGLDRGADYWNIKFNF